jgi:hypothetical protein
VRTCRRLGGLGRCVLRAARLLCVTLCLHRDRVQQVHAHLEAVAVAQGRGRRYALLGAAGAAQQVLRRRAQRGQVGGQHVHRLCARVARQLQEVPARAALLMQRVW